MRYLNKLLLVFLLFSFTLKNVGQIPSKNPYKIDFYNGYAVDLYFIKSEQYTTFVSVLTDNLDFAKTCKGLTIDEAIDWFVDNSYVYPLRIFSDRIMFEQICGGLTNELLNNIFKYKDNYERQSAHFCKEGNIKLKDGYRLVYQYSRYSGIVFVPLKGNDLYSSDCSNGINFQDYPNIRIAMPIYSGYTDE